MHGCQHMAPALDSRSSMELAELFASTIGAAGASGADDTKEAAMARATCSFWNRSTMAAQDSLRSNMDGTATGSSQQELDELFASTIGALAAVGADGIEETAMVRATAVGAKGVDVSTQTTPRIQCCHGIGPSSPSDVESEQSSVPGLVSSDSDQEKPPQHPRSGSVPWEELCRSCHPVFVRVGEQSSMPSHSDSSYTSYSSDEQGRRPDRRARVAARLKAKSEGKIKCSGCKKWKDQQMRCELCESKVCYNCCSQNRATSGLLGVCWKCFKDKYP